MEGDRRQNLVDELVTRQKQLEASYRNEGPEPDVTRYDTAALSEQRDSCWVCPEMLSDPWSSFTCSHVHVHSLGNPVLFLATMSLIKPRRTREWRAAWKRQQQTERSLSWADGATSSLWLVGALLGRGLTFKQSPKIIFCSSQWGLSNAMLHFNFYFGTSEWCVIRKEMWLYFWGVVQQGGWLKYPWDKRGELYLENSPSILNLSAWILKSLSLSGKGSLNYFCAFSEFLHSWEK